MRKSRAVLRAHAWGALVAIAIVLLNFDVRRAVSQDEPRVLWGELATSEIAVTWQLHPTGHLFVRADLFRKDRLLQVRGVMQQAYQLPSADFTRLRGLLVDAGLRDGAFMECKHRGRVGITPQLQLHQVASDCETVARTLDSLEPVAGMAKAAHGAILRWVDELERGSTRCPTPAAVEIEVKKDDVRAKPNHDGISACFLPSAFVEQEWNGMGANLGGFEFTGALKAVTLPVTMIVPGRPRSVFVHGFDEMSSLGAETAAALVPGTRSVYAESFLPLVFRPSATLDGKAARVAWPPKYPLKSGDAFAPSLTVWLLASLWTDQLSVVLKDGRTPPAKFSLRSGRLECEGFRFCDTLDEATTRGIVSAAMGACIATRREARRERNANPVDLVVTAGKDRCRLMFRGICLEHQSAGLDMLVDNREPLRNVKAPARPYAICGYPAD